MSDWVCPTLPVTYEGVGPLHLGVKFRATEAGALNKVRININPANSGSMFAGWRVQLFTLDGVLQQRWDPDLSTTTTGVWIDLALPDSWPVAANVTQLLTVWLPPGAQRAYCTDMNGLEAGPLAMLASGVDGPNGVYAGSDPDLMPAGPWPTYVPALWPVFTETGAADGMTPLGELRAQVAAALTAAVDVDTAVHDGPVDSVTPPALVLGWADTWLTPLTACHYSARLEVLAVGARIDPLPGYDQLETLVAAALPALDQLGAMAPEVSAPGPLEIGGLTYLTARITLTHPITLESHA
jgi:hypothetical protein